MNQTTVIAVGTMITPSRLRHLPDGTPVTSFRMACNERRLDRATGEWADRDSFYTTVTCWRRLAENVCVSLRSGDPIVVRGRLSTRSYDVEGGRNSVTDMEADVVAPDLTRCTAGVVRTRRSTASSAVASDDDRGTPDWTGGSEQCTSETSEAAAEHERQEMEALPAAGH